MKFIEVSVINAQNEQADTKAWIRADQITEVFRSTPVDQKHRREIASVVTVMGGGRYAIRETPEWVMDHIEANNFE